MKPEKYFGAAYGKKTGDGTGVGLFIPLPEPLASQFPSLGDADTSPSHCTFLYIGAVNKDQEKLFLDTLTQVFTGWDKSVMGVLDYLDYFIHPEKERHVAVMKIRFNQRMDEIRWKLRDALIEVGIHVDDGFPLVYQPHATLEYIGCLDTPYVGTVPSGSWTFNSIEVWGLPKLHVIPFQQTPTDRMASKYIASLKHQTSIELMKFLANAVNKLGAGRHVYVVGGAVRNFIISEPIKDIDIVVDSIGAGKDSAWLAKKLQKAIPTRTNLVTNQYGVAIITIKDDWFIGDSNLKGETIEIANARKESYGGVDGKGYKPHMVEPSTIQEDVVRREFTFNTLLWQMSELANGPEKAEILDMTGCGRKDLDEGMMRCPSNPNKTFTEDPSRMIRAIKFLIKYGFKIAPDVKAAIKRNAPKLKNIPSGHLSNMIVNLFFEPGYGSKALVEMKKLGLLDVVQEIAVKDKSFREALANWSDRSAKIDFLFELMDYNMPTGRRLKFLSKADLVKLRDITAPMSSDETERLIAPLEQPGKLVNMKALISEFGLKGQEIRQLTDVIRQAILKDPRMVMTPARLERETRKHMGKTAKVYTEADLFPALRKFEDAVEQLDKYYAIIHVYVESLGDKGGEKQLQLAFERGVRRYWEYVINAGAELSRIVLDQKAIPAGQAKKIEMAARLFMSALRFPKKFDNWMKKNTRHIKYLEEAAKKWKDKEEGDELFKIGPFDVHNTIGASDKDLEGIKTLVSKGISLVKKASGALTGYKKTLYGDVFVVGKLLKSHTMAWYEIGDDSVYMRLMKKVDYDDLQSLLHELAHRYWRKFLSHGVKTRWHVHHNAVGGSMAGKVDMPEVGDILPFSVNKTKKPKVLGIESGVYILEARSGNPLAVQKMTLYKWMQQEQKTGKYPTRYAATDAEEHFCEAMALYALGKLGPEHVKALEESLTGKEDELSFIQKDVAAMTDQAIERVAKGFKKRASYFRAGDPIFFGKYKNKKGIIKGFGQNSKNQSVTVIIELDPKGRKQEKAISLYNIWHRDIERRASVDRLAIKYEARVKEPWKMTFNEFRKSVKVQRVEWKAVQTFQDFLKAKRVNPSDIPTEAEEADAIGGLVFRRPNMTTQQIGRLKTLVRKKLYKDKLYKEWGTTVDRVESRSDLDLSRADDKAYLRVEHKRAIRKALHHRKHVPDKVLIEYPELTAVDRIASRSLKAKGTHNFLRIEKLMTDLREELPRGFYRNTPIKESQVKDIQRKARALYDALVFDFEGTRAAFLYKKKAHRKIENFRKFFLALTKVTGPEEMMAYLQKWGGKTKGYFEKFWDSMRFTLGVIQALDVERIDSFSVGKWNVSLWTSPRADWDDGKVGRLQWVLDRADKMTTSKGFGGVSYGRVNAYPSGNVPVSGHGSGSTMAMYNPSTDLVSLGAGKDVKRTLLDLIHELGHRYYFKKMGSRGRAAWEEFFEASQGSPNVDKLIADWERYVKNATGWDGKKYGRYLFQYYSYLKKKDPEQTMWLEMVADKIDINEPSNAYGPKKGITPGLDQLIARKGEANVFLHPVTAYSATSPSELFAETFSHAIFYGPNTIPEIVRDVFKRAAPKAKMASDRQINRIASKFQKKKEVPKADGKGTTTVYEYSEGQIQNRNRDKAKRIEALRGKLDKLHTSIKKDLKSKDEQTWMTALAIGLINDTFERVGNSGSANDGHFGVTGWQAKHVTLGPGKATFKYVGKSGVSQSKTTTDNGLVSALKAAMEGKTGSDPIFKAESFTVDSGKINTYLKPFDITAKDVRGLHANRQVQKALKSIRSAGGKLPTDPKEKEKKLKAEFQSALEQAAKAVGHEAATLKNQYLVPGLEDNYLKDGTVKENLARQKKATKTHGERDDEETAKLVKPLPKKNPPRYDLRNERVNVDKDKDTGGNKADNDKDMSLNYKRVAIDRLADRWLRHAVEAKKPGDIWKTNKGYSVKLDDDTIRQTDSGAKAKIILEKFRSGKKPEDDPSGKKKPQEVPGSVEKALIKVEEDKAQAKVDEAAAKADEVPQDEEPASKEEAISKQPEISKSKKQKRFDEVAAVYNGFIVDMGKDKRFKSVLKEISDFDNPQEVMTAFQTQVTDIRAEIDKGNLSPETIQAASDALENPGGDGMANAKMVGQTLALAMIAKKLIANPLYRGGQSSGLDAEGTVSDSRDLTKKARETANYYSSLTPILRQEAIAETKKLFTGLEGGSTQRHELDKLADGIHHAASVQGDYDDPRSGNASLRPPPGPGLQSVLQVLATKGEDQDILDIIVNSSKGGLGSDDAKLKIKSALDDLSDDDLYEACGGENGPDALTIDLLQNGGLSSKELEYVKDMLVGGLVDSISSHDEITARITQGDKVIQQLVDLEKTQDQKPETKTLGDSENSTLHGDTEYCWTCPREDGAPSSQELVNNIENGARKETDEERFKLAECLKEAKSPERKQKCLDKLNRVPLDKLANDNEDLRPEDPWQDACNVYRLSLAEARLKFFEETFGELPIDDPFKVQIQTAIKLYDAEELDKRYIREGEKLGNLF